MYLTNRSIPVVATKTKKEPYMALFWFVSHRLAGSNILSEIVQALEDFQAFVVSMGEAFLPAPAVAY